MAGHLSEDKTFRDNSAGQHGAKIVYTVQLGKDSTSFTTGSYPMQMIAADIVDLLPKIGNKYILVVSNYLT